ncbi:hypothetical protein FHR87_003343 [Azomonas macrocytogenes]|uniref:Uncharacterized protein n=1 Tax=Azomonas macrocytogenes TaxID=69962 RepID=A0A839TA46_AZOMA|nr:hypothetical protein [Azomonas macrocytogenes]
MTIQGIGPLIRLLLAPVTMSVGGLLLDKWLLPRLASANRVASLQVEAAFWDICHWGILCLVSLSAIWGLYRLWLYIHWRSGNSDGGCPSCGGPMQHLQEPHAMYSECMICGARKNGWVTEHRHKASV